MQKSVIIFVFGKFSEMSTRNEKGKFGLVYGHKIMMELEVHFKQEIQSDKLFWSHRVLASLSL